MSNHNETGTSMSERGCTCVMVRPMQREMGSGVPIAPPEWEQSDDCPVHPHLLHCETCGTQVVQLESSEETSGAMEAERQWLVTRLACGHTRETELVAGPIWSP